MLLPGAGSPSSPSSSSSSVDLNSPPPHSAPRSAGDDTRALLGDRPDSDVSGGGLSSIFSQTISGIAMLLQSINILDSALPGLLSPQFKAEAEMIMTTGPEAAKQASQMQNPFGLINAASALAGAGGGNGNGIPLMRPSPSAVGPAGMPMQPSMAQSAGVPRGGLM